MRAWISKFVFKIIDRCVIIIKIKCDYAALRRLPVCQSKHVGSVWQNKITLTAENEPEASDISSR